MGLVLALVGISAVQTSDPEPDATGSVAAAAGAGSLPQLNVTGISSGG